ncbi:putative inactive lipase [Corynebacterium urogenitale]|uniref:Putative inactive lipase n=1 Tax=Corynebacterium urogenitale TaxID=2487892 RepID=A0A5J6Z6Y5_9CORY|nr:lipase family protein [Corynebacterium urogenitale]QFQ01415.1 putative inactive lipase [Corynebacterium urogenitale]
MITTHTLRGALKAASSTTTALATATALLTFPVVAHAADDSEDSGAQASSLLSSVSDNQYPNGPSTGSSSPNPRTEKGDVDPFYETGDLTPSKAGEILRDQETNISGPLPGVRLSLPKTATKVIYTTTLADGTTVPVSGYMVEPNTPWKGEGERPTVVIGRGTVGQGDQCAPSRNWPLNDAPDPFTTGRLVSLEGLYDGIFATQGVRVFVTDYVGMGTPGMHTYMNRLEQAHAMLDGARAARNLVESRGGNFGKVGFYGHSQGGGASAAAVEEAAGYAPDLDVAGAYASAPPANLDEVQKKIDGSDLMGAIGFTINGLVVRYPHLAEDLNRHLSEEGKATIEDLSTMCTDEIEDKYGYQTTGQWTVDGRSLDELLDDLPEGEKAMNEQRIGNGTPAAPVMIISGRYDANVEYNQAKNLAKQWCEKGSQVVYRDDIMPPLADYNHFIQAVSGGPFGIGFLLNRFNNRPLSGTCSGFNGNGSGSSAANSGGDNLSGS